jgi:hypothetical protein
VSASCGVVFAPASAPVAAALSSGAGRWARGGTVGLVAVGVALAGHAAGGASAPEPAALSAVALGAALIGVALSGRQWTLGPLLGLLLGAEAVLHVLFGTGGDPAATAVGGFQHAHHHAAAAATADHGALGMLPAHVLAALITALLLRRGEQWCWAPARALARPLRIALLAGAPPVPPRSRLPVTGQRPHSPRSLMLAAALPDRGPPAGPTA